MKIIITLFLLMSFSSLANDGIVAEKTSYSIEASYGPGYPGGKKNKKKGRKGKRANKKRNKMCRKMHRNRG